MQFSTVLFTYTDGNWNTTEKILCSFPYTWTNNANYCTITAIGLYYPLWSILFLFFFLFFPQTVTGLYPLDAFNNWYVTANWYFSRSLSLYSYSSPISKVDSKWESKAKKNELRIYSSLDKKKEGSRTVPKTKIEILTKDKGWLRHARRPTNVIKVAWKVMENWKIIITWKYE